MAKRIHSCQHSLIEKREMHKKRDIFLWKMVVSTIKKRDFPPENGTVDSYAYTFVASGGVRTKLVLYFL